MSRFVKTPFDDLADSEVLSARDIAERLHVHERSVRRAISRGELAASRACGLRVLAGDAAAWWRARMVDPDGAAKDDDGPEQTPRPVRPSPRVGRRRLSTADAGIRGGGA